MKFFTKIQQEYYPEFILLKQEINFGWIGINGLDEKEYFYKYIEEDIDRNIERIKKYIEDKNVLKSFIKKANMSVEKLKIISNIKPVICWYDINPNNILVNDNSSITGFLDPGGARFAPKEWDLAFIKMYLCQNNK